MHCYCSFKGVVYVQPEDRPAKIKINIVNTEKIMSKDIRKPWRLMLATDRERCICKESSSFRDGVRLITTHCKHLNTYTLCYVTLLPGHSSTCTPPTSVLFFLSIFVSLFFLSCLSLGSSCSLFFSPRRDSDYLSFVHAWDPASFSEKKKIEYMNPESLCSFGSSWMSLE